MHDGMATEARQFNLERWQQSATDTAMPGSWILSADRLTSLEAVARRAGWDSSWHPCLSELHEAKTSAKAHRLKSVLPRSGFESA